MSFVLIISFVFIDSFVFIIKGISVEISWSQYRLPTLNRNGIYVKIWLITTLFSLALNLLSTFYYFNFS